MSFCTCFWLLPQNEHFSRSPPSPMRATRRSFQLVCPERGALRVVLRRSGRCRPGPRAPHVRLRAHRHGPLCSPYGALGAGPVPRVVPRRYRGPLAHTLIQRRCRRCVTGVPPRADNTPRVLTPAAAAGEESPWPVGQDRHDGHDGHDAHDRHGCCARSAGRSSRGHCTQESSEPLRLRRTSSIWPYSLAASADRILSRSMSFSTVSMERQVCLASVSSSQVRMRSTSLAWISMSLAWP